LIAKNLVSFDSFSFSRNHRHPWLKNGYEDFVGEDTLTVSHLDYLTQVIPVVLLEDKGFSITLLLVRI